MTDRTVTVRLRATVDEYQRQMRAASSSTGALDRSVGQLQQHSTQAFGNIAGSAKRHILGSTLGALGAAGLGGGLVKLAFDSSRTAAGFDVSMRQIAVATGAPMRDIESLRRLALKMGADTVFSAQDAGDAMLELAKGGLTEAQIKAGALASTLTLASAGGLDLGSAAGYIVQGLSTFNLSASQSRDVASALAGAANASTASVQDMGLALSQVGPGATQAGLTLQETTAVLAAFAQNGIKGSDAGTSLKTMLQRLVPQTDKQSAAMKKLGLNFFDSKGHFKDIADIAQQLHDKLGPLSQAQRANALNTIFGSDASRAASVLMKEGAKGVQEYTRATSDKTQADKLAAAATSGAAGAFSQLSGSVDTAKLQLGEALAPLMVDLANHTTTWANDITEHGIPALARFIKGMEDGTGPGGDFVGVLGDIKDAGQDVWAAVHPFFTFVAEHPHLFTQIAKDVAIYATAVKGIGVLTKLPGVGTLGTSLAGSATSALTSRGATAVNPLFVYDISGKSPGGLKSDLEKLFGAKVSAGFLGRLAPAFRGAAGGVGSVLIASGDTPQKGGYGGTTADDQVKDALSRAFAAFALGEDHSGAFVKYRNTGSQISGMNNPQWSKAGLDSYNKAFNGGKVDKALAINWLLRYGNGAPEARRLLRQLGFQVPDAGGLPSSVEALADDPQALKRFQARIAQQYHLSGQQAAELGNLITQGLGRPLDQAKGKADALTAALDRAFRPRLLQIQMATGQLSLHAYENNHPDTSTPAPVRSNMTPASTPATRDAGLHRAGLHIAGNVIIQQVPGESTSGSFVRGLEHAAFLASAG